MIDENRLLKAIEKKFEYYDKDGQQIRSDKFTMRVSDIKKLIREQTQLEAPTFSVAVTTTSTKVTTWQDIKRRAIAGKMKDVLKSGDIIPLTLANGDEVDLVVGYDKNGRAYFIFDKAMSDCHNMNKVRTNVGGYARSGMSRYADEEVFDMLPIYIQHLIEPTTIVQVLGGERRETKHKLFCLSYTQVFGKTAYFAEQEPEDTQIDIFENVHARNKVRVGASSASWWWLRSASGSATLAAVYTDGSYSNYSASNSGAVVLGFCLEPNHR